MSFFTFTPAIAPSVSSRNDLTARLIENQFGDGYRQTAGDGLNNLVRSITLTWNALKIQDASDIEAFLTVVVGQPFYYTLPRETAPRLWDCKKFSRTYPAGGYDGMTADLTQRFDLG